LVGALNDGEKVWITPRYWDDTVGVWRSKVTPLTENVEYQFSFNTAWLRIYAVDVVDGVHICYAATTTYVP
jgi:hypothetical protein